MLGVIKTGGFMNKLSAFLSIFLGCTISAQAQEQEVIRLFSEKVVLIKTKLAASDDGVRADGSISLTSSTEILGVQALLVEQDEPVSINSKKSIARSHQNLEFYGCHVSIENLANNSRRFLNDSAGVIEHHVQVLCPKERLPEGHHLGADQTVHLIVRHAERDEKISLPAPVQPKPPVTAPVEPKPPVIVEPKPPVTTPVEPKPPVSQPISLDNSIGTCSFGDSVRGHSKIANVTYSSCKLNCYNTLETALKTATVSSCVFSTQSHGSITLMPSRSPVSSAPVVPNLPVVSPTPAPAPVALAKCEITFIRLGQTPAIKQLIAKSESDCKALFLREAQTIAAQSIGFQTVGNQYGLIYGTKTLRKISTAIQQPLHVFN